jgi:radical SAM superfamily enzyme YgiQ (UPF0313 family)
MSKKVRIALVNPPILKGVYRHQLYLPIGLAYLAAVLEAKGHDVTVIDCPADNVSHDQLRERLASHEPLIVGITSMTPTIQSALQSARVAKEACPNATTILGGSHATFMDEQVLSEESAVDVVVRSEGEQTIVELAQLSDSKGLPKIDGITFRNEKQIVRTPNRPFIQKLDELPRPAYKYFPLEKYRLFGRAILPIITSRGCPFQCSFCVTSRMFGRAFRARSPKNVVDELEWLRDAHGAEAFTFYDDTLTFDKKRILEICQEIKNRKIGIPWDCQTRVDQISKEILAKMREANCQQVFFGVESGCQQMLNAMNKRTSIEQNEKAIKWAKELGLFVAVPVIIGYPGETWDTLRQTLDFLQRMKPDDAYICMATPYPGTELRALVEKMGWKMSSNWSLYDTVTPVFENPRLPSEKIKEMRKTFYNNFYSPSYIFRQSLKGLKGNFYSRIMARTALNHILWRIRSLV